VDLRVFLGQFLRVFRLKFLGGFLAVLFLCDLHFDALVRVVDDLDLALSVVGLHLPDTVSDLNPLNAAPPDAARNRFDLDLDLSWCDVRDRHHGLLLLGLQDVFGTPGGGLVVAGSDPLQGLFRRLFGRRLSLLEVMTKDLQNAHTLLATSGDRRLGQGRARRGSELLQVPAGLAARRELAGIQLLDQTGDFFVGRRTGTSSRIVGKTRTGQQQLDGDG
jgi:hypothetical protein